MLTIGNNIYNPQIRKILMDNSGSQLKIEVMSIEGNITTLYDEQIASFVELMVKYENIDEITAQVIRNHFKHIITGLNTREQTSIDNLSEQYKILYSQIKNELLSANDSGKKLLILVGEDHRDRKSLILELMLLDIANKLGVKNLLTETDKDSLEQIKSIPIRNIESPNFSFVLKFARKLNFNLSSCDPEANCYKIDDIKRADAINQFVVNFNQNSTCILGVNHLMDVYNNKAIRRQYDILAFNASNIGERKKEYLFKKESYPKEPINFALFSPSVIQLNLNSNPYSLGYKDMKRIMKKFSAIFSESSVTPKAFEKCVIVHKIEANEPNQTMFVKRLDEELQRRMKEMTIEHLKNIRLEEQISFGESFKEINNRLDVHYASSEYARTPDGYARTPEIISLQSYRHYEGQINQSLDPQSLRTFNSLENQDQSLNVLNEQIKDCPGNIPNRLARAGILLSKGKNEEAKEDYLYVLSKYPKNIQAKNNLAIIDSHTTKV